VKKKLKILIVAGEASADLHAAHLLKELQKKFEIEARGVGGDQLSKAGVKIEKHARDMAVVGLTEAIKKVPQTITLLRQMGQSVDRDRPDFALLLDLPDVNLRLASRLKAKGVPVIYYVSPQVWAWRSKRVKTMARDIDLLLSILPFEKKWYETNAPKNFHVEYVGHPVMTEIPNEPYAPEEKHLVIMPGSRENEWKTLAKPMIEAAALLSRADSSLRFTLPLAEPLRSNEFVLNCLSPVGECGDSIRSLGDHLTISHDPAHKSLRLAKAAWIASGTATLEAGVVGAPMVVAYKVSATSAFIFKNLVRYSGPIAMVNLIHCGLGSAERLVPELLQDSVESFALASAMREILQEPKWSELRSRLSQTRSLLKGQGDPIQNACRQIELFAEKL